MEAHWLDKNNANVAELIKAIEGAGWGVRQLDVETTAIDQGSVIMTLLVKIEAIPKGWVA